jgi:hypothetical protein
MAPKNKNKKKDKKKSENQKNEAKEELNKDEQVRKQQRKLTINNSIINRLILFFLVNELNDLIDKILNIFNTMSDVPPSWFAYVNKFKEDVNEPSNEYYDETEIDQAIHQLQTFISSMKLDEKQTKELEEIIGCVQTVAHKLFVNMIFISFYFFRFFACRMILLIFDKRLKILKKINRMCTNNLTI